MEDPVDSQEIEDWKAAFLAALPRIRAQARCYFRDWQKNSQKYDEAITDTCGLAWKWYALERRKGRSPDEYISKIAEFSCKQVRVGRSVAGHERSKDVLSPRAQRGNAFTVQTLPECDTGANENEAIDALADNRVASPADQAAFRTDTPKWLDRLDADKRGIVGDMMQNFTTKEIAERRNRSPGRISQIRREAFDDYLEFHSELEPSGR